MVRLGLALLIVLAMTGTAQAVENADYDRLNGVSLQETPYTSSATLNLSASYDTTAFTETEEYITENTAIQHAGCAAFGARSAWVRFVTAVSGRLAVRVFSNARPYDVLYRVERTPTTIPSGTAQLSDLAFVECHNENRGFNIPNEEYSFQGGYPIPAGSVVYVQTLSACKQGSTLPPCTAEERAAALGGATVLELTFKPDNQDGDGVGDGADVCPALPGITGGVPSNGCPDGDGDGVTEPGDQCVGTPGKNGQGCRRPDEDEDGAVDSRLPGGTDCNDDNPLQKPSAPETLVTPYDDNCDGKLFPDVDGDDFDDSVKTEDCDPSDPAINKAATEIVGNKVDEDCDEDEAPFPRVTSVITPFSLELPGSNTWVGFNGFQVNDIAARSRITIFCRGCPFKTKTYRFKRAVERKRLAQKQFFGYGQLDRGTSVTVHVWRDGAIGRAVRFTLDGKGGPKRSERCSLPTARNKLRKTCPGTV